MRKPWRLPLLSAALSLAVFGCSSTDAESTSEGDGTPDPVVDDDGNPIPNVGQQVGPDGQLCMSNRDFLATQAWSQVFSRNCVSCHGPGGVAEQENAEFALKPAAYPGFLEVNLENISQVARTSNDGVSILLRKPLGELNHKGGAVLTQDSPEYQTLTELVERVTNEETCPEQPLVASFSDVELLDPVATFRKITLQLNGRLPTAAEIDALMTDGDAALPELVQGLFAEDAFYERLIEVFNDQWLTDRYLRDSQNVLDDEDFPMVDGYYDGLPDDQREAARRSIAREPLQLMAHIVRNDRPFTEILTADYTVFNSYTAPIYNNEDMSFSGSYDENEVQEGKIFIIREGQKLAFPHAGILSSPMFLNRYPTSRTNRNRHRARIVLREFLATDILKVADRPIDPTKAANFANPTREDPDCKTCHAIIDPIAGAFQKWDDNDQEQYVPDREWHQEMFLPGYGEEQMQVNDYPQALQWLGQRVAADPRFPLSVVRNVYQSLVGEEPLSFPDDPLDGTYPAWEAQEATIRSIASDFVASDYNLKTVIQQIVLSPYYRAKNTTATSEERLAQLGAVGTGQLLTPELLHRKILATVGIPWRFNNRDALMNEYKILFGGIDSDSVTERLTVPNGIMSAIGWRMANEVSCKAVSYDFSKPTEDRWLFPKTELDVVPEDDLAKPDPKGEETIKQNIQHMYALILGERLAMDSPEMARAYGLFLDTWREGRSKLAAEEVDRNLPGDCQYRRDPFNNVDIPEDQRLTRDENYVIRSWMAVTTYLLSDYRFLYE